MLTCLKSTKNKVEIILKSPKISEKLNKISPLAASEYIAKSVFIHWLCIYKPRLKTRFALEILSH